MKKFVLAAAVAVVAATAQLPAHAAPLYDWRGLGCSFETLNDTTPGGQLGGQNVWNGAVVVAIRSVNNDAGPDPDGDGPLVGTPATPAPTASVSVDCMLSINSGTPTNVLHAEGTGSAANADQIQFTAASGSVIVLCSEITINGEHIQDCGTAEESPVCPDPICGPGGVLEVIFNVVDPLICPIIATLAPGVPGVLNIDSEGDIYLIGNTEADELYDCPAYD